MQFFKIISIRLFLLGVVVSTLYPALAVPNVSKHIKQGSYVRVEKLADYSTSYLRKKSATMYVKKNYKEKKSGERILRSKTIYRIDRNGFARSCRIYDAKNTLLFIVRYGFSKKTGKLLVENMYDAKHSYVDPKTKKQIPVRRVYYFYDKYGNQTKQPIAVTTVKSAGVTATYQKYRTEKLQELGILKNSGGTYESKQSFQQ